MSNPTIQSLSQFQKPFNILPDLLYTNPTSQTPSQFTAPFNILPDPTIKNPTNSAQFKLQFKRPFNILPDTIFTNPSTIKGSDVLPGLGGLNYRRPQDSYGIVYSADTALVNQEKIDNVGDSNIINWRANEYTNTNIDIKTPISNVLGLGSLAAASLTAIPIIGSIGTSIANNLEDSLSGRYSTLPLNKLTTKILPGTDIQSPVQYLDFRSRIRIQGGTDNFSNQLLSYTTAIRLDGLSAASRGSIRAGIYSAAAASPAGAYSIFNLNGATGESGYGWGEHDNPYAIRKDFTLRSHVAKRWKYVEKEWAPSLNPTDIATPFRGDKVNVIDFGKRSLNDAYLWNPSRISSVLGINLNSTGVTQDFIKFYMTGPNLVAGSDATVKDDIIVFRAVITSLDDSFTANWTPIQMIGRADPNYAYTSYGRDLSLGFTVYATDRDELQPIYRKLNALAGYTAPTYDPNSIAMEGPWMRLTIGDLFVQQPVTVQSISYTYDVADAPYEINIENDPTMMQVPLKISVQMQFNVISDYLPQKGGRFYTLAKRFNSITAEPKTGNDNWLSDAGKNINVDERLRARLRTARGRDVQQS